MPSDSGIRISPEVAPLVRIGVVRAEPVAVGPASAALGEEMDAIARSLRETHGEASPSEIPALAPARDLYRAFGMDPTRTRPSSEGLVRRALQGKPMPRILNAVDVSNLCSMLFFLPIGLYDAGKVRGEIVLRRGLPGESYPGIRKEDVHVERRPVLADSEGAFGNPTSDSLRTAVDGSTRLLILVIFAPASYSRARLEAHAVSAGEKMERYLGSSEITPVARTLVLPFL